RKSAVSGIEVVWESRFLWPSRLRGAQKGCEKRQNVRLAPIETRSWLLAQTSARQTLCASQRQRERECRAHAQLALHPDPTPMQLDELPTEGQTQPSALHLLVCRPHLAELLEHRVLILRGDADTGIAD